MRFSLFLIVVLFVYSQSGLAGELTESPEALIKRADRAALSESPEWHKLLHYYADSSFESQVDDRAYFLSENGKYNSAEELEASIRVLLGQHNAAKDDQHPRCLFVEREKWLRGSLGLERTNAPAYCKKYHEWIASINAHSITLVFPASYLNSPSSMFGHTLIRFDPENIDTDSTWLSYSLSYAADTSKSESDSPYLYAFKGLAGGYPGRFSVVPYFKKIQEYGALENRDVWEYKLNLSKSEVDRMLGHAWELQNVKFDYFYFRENCAFRLLELLDYARPTLRLTDQFDYTTIPADTVKAVVDSGLVQDVFYRPSIGTLVQFNIQIIPAELRHWVSKIETNPSVADSEDFLALDIESRRQIVMTANQFLTYKSRKTAMTPEMAKKRFKMLHLVNRYPTAEPVMPEQPERPDASHDTHLLSVAHGRDRKQRFTNLQYRISYHDILDNSQGYPRGAEISLGDLNLRWYRGDNVRIESFNVIGIRSLGAWHAIFDSISWEVSAGFARDNDLENGRMAGRIKGGVGKTALMSKNVQGFALLRLAASIYDRGEHKAYLNPSVATGIIGYSKAGTTLFELELESLQHRSARYTASLNHNLVLSKNHALRFESSFRRFDDQNDENVSLGYRYYF